MKNKHMLLLSSTLLLISIGVYCYVNGNGAGKKIECSSRVGIAVDDLQFEGLFVNRLYDKFGTILVTGVIKKNNVAISTVDRLANINFQRVGNVIFITNVKITKDDDSSTENLKKLLPAYTYAGGGGSFYAFIKQNDGGFVVKRGRLPLAYCSE